MNSPIEEIKSRLDIAEVVGGYIRLTRAGANLKALCPFHTEKTPSFNVSPTRQIWHCFGCGRGGDHFKFVMEVEGLDFPEALRMLAKRAGVELKREDPRLQSERNRLHDILEDASKYFHQNLNEFSAAKGYLKKRGVSDKSIEDFRIGFSFDAWDGLLGFLRKRGYKDAEVEKAGLAVRGENGSWYDRFRSRIMFPIADASGHVLGFGGRIFEYPPNSDGRASVVKATDGAAKYINTPQTLVYDKSRVLYAFHRAKDSIRKQNSCVIVEGYMDAVMSHQAGINNAVAVSGTALTPLQLKTIRRLADTLISSFDRDLAGQAATKRSLDLAAEFDFERKAAVLPKGIKDPADAVLANPETWLRAVDGALPIVQFYFQEALSKHNTQTAAGAKSIAAEVLPEIYNLSNEVERAHWVRKLSQTLGISEESVWQELAKVKIKEDTTVFKDDILFESALPKSRRENLEELSLGSLVIFSDLRAKFAGVSTDIFMKDLHREIFKNMVNGQKPDDFKDELKNYISHLAFRAEVFFESIDDKPNEVVAVFRELEGEHLKYCRDVVTRKIVEAERAGNEILLSDLSREYKIICEKLHNLSVKV